MRRIALATSERLIGREREAVVELLFARVPTSRVRIGAIRSEKLANVSSTAGCARLSGVMATPDAVAPVARAAGRRSAPSRKR